MITTITLNPALDKTMQLPNLVIGQVNRIRNVVTIPGGKGINVAKIIHQLKGEVTASGFLGGYQGRFIESSLKKKIPCRFLKIEGETRCNCNILGADGYVTEILEPGPNVLKQEWENFKKLYEELVHTSEIMVLSGSLPNGIASEAYQELIEKAKEKGKKVLLDTSGEALQKAIEAKPFFIKPNQKELEFVMGVKLSSIDAMIQAALELRQKGVNNLLLSRGEKGFLYVGEEGNYVIKIPKVKAVNTVGCGDSIVAVMAMGYEKGEEIVNLLRQAAAVSVANATTIESGVIPLQKIDEIAAAVKIEKYK